ncbi:expressed unknown protein [Seminavis robusta]|uniref:DEP domain-containing protein n=1 Tax=Seminavis robusta TaxID=568900 RepID=A0A9N8EG44_9STRA|nr:expressed unknown protein [Seminavis robusta]|eukprot:Sro948_g223590.1 n/a (346) ;mRNA; r:27858-28895
MMLDKKFSSARCLNGSTGSYKPESPESFELETVAETFQNQLFAESLVQDRLVGNKTIARSFLGSDAVTTLTDILQLQRLQQPETAEGFTEPASPVTREEALKVGRSIAEEFSFFAHHAATSKNGTSLVLEDSDQEVYVFEKNLPMQVHQVKKMYPSPWDRVGLLEQHVEVKDRRGLVRVFNSCFVASEAVDAMMGLRIAKSRREAVHMVRKMNEKVNFFKPANTTDRSEFKDDKNMFLKFIPKENREPEPKRHHHRMAASLSPKRSSPKGLRKTKSLQHEGPLRPTSVSPKSTRRLKTHDGEGSLNGSRASSPTKDRKYFEDRAKDIRGRLDELRDSRLAANAAA